MVDESAERSEMMNRLTPEELRAFFRSIPDAGNLDAGLVLSDYLEELGYLNFANALRKFIRLASPIEREILQRGLSEGTATQALWRPLRGPWSAVKKRFDLIVAQIEGWIGPLRWLRVETGPRASLPGNSRCVSRPVHILPNQPKLSHGYKGFVRVSMLDAISRNYVEEELVHESRLEVKPSCRLAPDSRRYLDLRT